MSSSARRPTCRCGHGLDHHTIVARPSYGVWGWFLLLMGATGTPKKITYRCLVCKQVVHTTRDPRVLRSFR